MRTLLRGGVGVLAILVLLLAAQMAFGARGSAAQEPPGIPVWLYFQANEGDTCWALAKEFRGYGRFCEEEMLPVNRNIEFTEDDVPIIVAGEVYWLHPRWAANRYRTDRELYESVEHMIVPQQPEPPPAIALTEEVVQEQGGGDVATTDQIIFGVVFGAVAGALIVILIGVTVTTANRRRAVLDLVLGWIRQRKLCFRRST